MSAQGKIALNELKSANKTLTKAYDRLMKVDEFIDTSKLKVELASLYGRLGALDYRLNEIDSSQETDDDYEE